MDYFTPGIRELGRKALRCSLRLQSWWRQRQLARAETALGFLGWQQADFDPETERQVAAINNVEREQGKLINEAADCSAEIRRRRSELEALQRVHGERRREAAEAARKIRAPLPDVQQRLEQKRKFEPNFERHIPELDRELREVNKLLAELLRTDQQSAKMRQELTHLRERTVAIPNEKNDLRTQHFRIVTEIRGLEEEIERINEALARHARAQEELEEQWAAAERELSAQIKEFERKKGGTEKQIAALESAKANPYQQIGRVLAHAGVGPVNQPQALQLVKDRELALQETLYRLSASEAATTREDAKLLRASLWLWYGFFTAAGLLLMAAVFL